MDCGLGHHPRDKCPCKRRKREDTEVEVWRNTAEPEIGAVQVPGTKLRQAGHSPGQRGKERCPGRLWGRVALSILSFPVSKLSYCKRVHPCVCVTWGAKRNRAEAETQLFLPGGNALPRPPPPHSQLLWSHWGLCLFPVWQAFPFTFTLACLFITSADFCIWALTNSGLFCLVYVYCHSLSHWGLSFLRIKVRPVWFTMTRSALQYTHLVDPQ